MKLDPNDIELTLSPRQHAILMAALRYAEENPEALAEHLGCNDEHPADAEEIGDTAVWVNCQ